MQILIPELWGGAEICISNKLQGGAQGQPFEMWSSPSIPKPLPRITIPEIKGQGRDDSGVRGLGLCVGVFFPALEQDKSHGLLCLVFLIYN